MTANSQTVRVFVALDLPVQAKAILRQTVQELGNLLPGGIRWVDPAGIHLTLKFLGDVDTGRVDSLLAAILVLALLLATGRLAWKQDPNMLSLLREAARSKVRYDPGKWTETPWYLDLR